MDLWAGLWQALKSIKKKILPETSPGLGLVFILGGGSSLKI